MNRHYRPMLAQSVQSPFDSGGWIFEAKWDGIRAISYVDADLSIRSRNEKELKYNFPELEELKNLTQNTVLDGEIVLIVQGKTDFQTLLERSRTASVREAELMSRKLSATYIVFDILERDGEPVINLPLLERKKMLKEHVREGQHVVLSLYVETEGQAYYEAALEKGFEGIMAKKKNSPYQPGFRSGDWLKIKRLASCDCVIFGYTQGEGRRAETFGALILGLYEDDRSVFVGKVGTGFSQKTIGPLVRLLQSLEAGQKTLEVDVPEKVTWVRPELVCQVVYQSVTREGKLRMPRFRGLRTDKAPFECSVDQIRRDGLREYVLKRDFNVTLEPKGGVHEEGGTNFVVQEHHAGRLHYDLRLEKDGVLKSWAVPKGIPEEPGVKRLAVETEDHPLEYRNFEGTIPPGQYGAGTVKTWDKGSYEPKVWNENMIEFTLNGKRLHGKYVLTRLVRAGAGQWLLLKARDKSG
jgi:DNA ligase D-like protein (predicted ligase)/DNA ligase D-like protein (predicted 3'-phosphoesterase)